MKQKSSSTIIYSYSRLDTFRQCPRQYAYRYIEKPDIEKTPSVEAFLGSVCHDTIQQIYKDLRYTRLLTLEGTLALYESSWERLKPPVLRIVRERYSEEDYRRMGRKYIQDFYEQNAPFDEGRTIGIEKEVRIELDGELVLVGYIDRLVDHGSGSYEIIDYKTSLELPGVRELEENWQLPLYHIGLSQMLPDLKEVTCTWYFLAHGKQVSLKRTREDLRPIERDVMELVRKIEATREFEPRVSALCSWCDYESICPARKHILATEEMTPQEFLADHGVRLVDKYMEARKDLEAAKEKVENLQERIFRYAEEQNLKALRGSRDKLTIWSKRDAIQIPSKEKDPITAEAVVGILKRHGLWERFSNLSSFQLAKAIENQELPPQVLSELLPYTTRQDIWRIYPSRLQEWV